MGARPVNPDIPGLDLRGVYDFVSLVEELDYEPTRCVIIGGSKVAMEYGSFFQATGCDTTIVSRSPLMRTKALHHVDEDLRQLRRGRHAQARHDDPRGGGRRSRSTGRTARCAA